MKTALHDLHVAVGLRFGRDLICGQKFAYGSEEAANKSIDLTTRHLMEAYPCAFCLNWHVGPKMSEEALRDVAYAPLSIDELAGIPTSLLLRDVIAHGCDTSNLDQLCDRCCGKWDEIDRRLPPRAVKT